MTTTTDRDDERREAERAQLVEFFATVVAACDVETERRRGEPGALARLGDPAWWEVALPQMHVTFAPRLVSYRRGDVPAASVCRFDPVVAELLTGYAARLSTSPLAPLQLDGLRAQRWLRDWGADVRRTDAACAALGVEPAAPVWPGIPRYLVPAAEWLIDHDGRALLMVMALGGSLGVPMLPGVVAPARPWLWPWELGASMPPRALQWRAGEPIPLPVVVPADFDPAWGDLYGFTDEWVPGEQLVVDDLERVLDAWSGRVGRISPTRGPTGTGLTSNFTYWHRGRPLPSSPEDLPDVVEVVEQVEVVPTVEHVVHVPRRPRALSVAPDPAPAADVEAEFLDGFQNWRSL